MTARELAEAENKHRHELIAQGLRPGCWLTVRHGNKGTQMAVLVWETRTGMLKVKKFLANSRRWTKPVTVSPLTVLAVTTESPEKCRERFDLLCSKK